MKPKNQAWNKLLELVQRDDGQKVFDAGPWSADKLYWWHRYIEITTSAMVGHPAWPAGVTYVDLFCGPGVTCDKESRTRYPGSPLIAALAPKPFTRILLCERNPESAAACEARLKLYAPSNRNWTVFVGDSNDQIKELAREIPRNSLALAFIDPTGLHAHFETLRCLTHGRAVDLLILFADHMDIVRNVELYAGQADSNLDRVLGMDCPWRQAWQELTVHSRSNIARLFAELYQKQLQSKLGYVVFDQVVLSNSKSDAIYRLFYASRNDKGLDFWKKSTAKYRRVFQEFNFD